MRRFVRDQRGIASIIIVTVIVTVVSMIVVGFSSVIRREQRQALDLQLSSQAKLAAETALNDKIAEFRNNPTAFADVTTCPTPTKTFTAAGTDEIMTTCILVDKSPGSLQYDEVPTDSSTIVWLDTGGENMGRLVISWQNVRSAAGNQCRTTGYNVLPQASSGNELGMLRFDLIKVDNGASPSANLYSRDEMRQNAFGGVLYPKAPTSTAELTTSPGTNDQPVIFGTCGNNPAGIADPYWGQAIIRINPNNSARYVLRLRGLYRPSMVKIQGYTVANREIAFRDAQVVIEATARVNDIVQRLQARVPAGTPPSQLVPDDAIHATAGICKLLITEPSATSTGGC